jgi:hypothetical protein
MVKLEKVLGEEFDLYKKCQLELHIQLYLT